MKTFLRLVLLVLILNSCQKQERHQQQKSITAGEIQIAKDLIQGAFDDLWAGVDSTKITTYHTDDFIILEKGDIWDNDRIKAYMRQQLSVENRPKRTNCMDFIAIEKYGASMQIAYWN